MENIKIARVTLNEAKQLQKISKETFYQAFSASNSEEDMNQYLEQSFSLEKLTAELANENSEFYFALVNSGIIGYLKLNYEQAQTDLKDEKGIEIERIYVEKEFHGKKVAQLLYEKAIQRATEKNADYVWLGVWEKNPRAISFYKKNGFTEFDKHSFKLGNDEQTDIMMKRKMK